MVKAMEVGTGSGRFSRMNRRRPNILFVTSDQQHPNAWGGEDPRVRTPAMDRLAAEGLTLTRSYSCSPLCTPTRASWVTGQYPSRHGAWNVGTLLNPDCLSVADLLGRAGYRTAIFGKSHFQPCLGTQGNSDEGQPRSNDTAFHRRWHGPWYGFEHAEISVGHTTEPHSASMHYRAWLEDQGVDIARYFHGVRPLEALVWELPEKFHPCVWAADRALAYLDEHADRHADAPFFLNLHFPDPHLPMHVPEPWFSMYADTPMRKPVRQWDEWRDKCTLYQAVVADRVDALGWHDRFSMASSDLQIGVMSGGPASAEAYTPYEAGVLRAYWGMISLLDAQLGRVLHRLDALGLADDTLIIYTSDHGELGGDHFLKGKGALHYDGCARVPMIVRWPGRISAGRRSAELVSGVDMAPTFLAAAGLPIHPEMQGVTHTGAWTQKSGPARRGVWIDFRAERGLYVNSWITDRHRLSVYHTPDADEFELFDFEKDPNEFANLAAGGAESGLVATLTAAMLGERSRVAYPWTPRIAFA